MSNDLSAFGPIFSALGCTLVYNSEDASLRVADAPTGKIDVVTQAEKDISYFDDTANKIDGVSALCVANFIDDVKNPIDEKSRLRILEALGIMKDGQYIYQVLSLQKNNRSWHHSGIPADCEHFGEVCTHRGINPDPNRKGRISHRNPQDYHRESTKGIAREQLVTPALEKVFRMIPDEALTNGRTAISLVNLDFKKLRELPIETRLRVIEELKESIA